MTRRVVQRTAQPTSFWRHFGTGLGLLGFWGMMLVLDTWLLKHGHLPLWTRVLGLLMAVAGTLMTVQSLRWRLEIWRLRYGRTDA